MKDIHHKTILLVEDEPLIAEMEKRQLVKEGYRIITAFSGEDAIDIVFSGEEAIDLILMDVDLGSGMDGTEAATVILKEREIPVVFLSSHTEKEVVQKTEKITSYGYVVKNSGIIVLDASIKMAFRLFESKMKEREKKDALRESREIFRDLSDKAIAGVYFIQDDKFLYVNTMLAEILGYSIGEIVNSIEPTDVIFNEDRPFVEDSIKKTLSGDRESGRYEFRIVTRSGEVRDVEVYSSRTLFNGMPAIIGTVVDITERKRSEEELRRVNSILSLITENMSEGVVLSDMGMHIRYITPSVVKRHGYTLEELNSIPVEKRMSKESFERLVKIASQELTPERLADPELDILIVTELEYYRKDGSTCWSESSFRLIRDINGKPEGILGVGRDITERKHVEDALKKSEERFRELSEDLPVYICTYLPDSTMTYANSLLAEMNGMSVQEITGKKFLELLEPADRGCVEKAIRGLSADNPAEFHEQIYRTPDGAIRYHEWRNRAFFDDKEEPVRYLSVGIDITDRKLAENRIRELLKEQELILKEVHHRVKNNLNTIFSLLLLQADDSEQPETKNILLDSAGRVQSMMVLYDKLYRSDINRKVPVKDYFPALVKEIAAIFPQNFNLTIHTEIDDIFLNTNMLSPLGIIINELITNAMKYAFAGRSEGNICLKILKAGSRIRILFEDDGGGIPENVTFDASSGFGLQLVSMLVRQIKGGVKMERVNGTRFIIEFEE